MNISQVAMTNQSCKQCYLRRSNAIRIKSRNSKILPLRRRDSSPGKSNKNVESNLLDQIKMGVRLQPVKQIPFRRDSGSDNTCEQESISVILARVLAARSLAMQQTDDESELSSIDSQPEHYEQLNLQEAITGTYEASPSEMFRMRGRVDVIVRL